VKYNTSWKKAYSETVEFAVIAALEAVGEGGQFSLQEFCDQYSFKKTYNLRRRMEELVQRGVVARAERYLANGHLGYVFFKPETYEPLPFQEDPGPDYTETTGINAKRLPFQGAL